MEPVTTPVDAFSDAEGRDPLQLTGQATLWWLISDSGRDLLMACYNALEDPKNRRNRGAPRAAHVLDVVARGKMTIRDAIDKWPLEEPRPWSEASEESFEILTRLAREGVILLSNSEHRDEITRLRELADNLEA